jgi:hypothetical protein
LRVKPGTAFPVHDAVLKTPSSSHRWPKAVLEPAGITWVSMEEGSTVEF